MTATLIIFAHWFVGAFGFSLGLVAPPAALMILYKRLKL